MEEVSVAGFIHEQRVLRQFRVGDFFPGSSKIPFIRGSAKLRVSRLGNSNFNSTSSFFGRVRVLSTCKGVPP